MLVVETIAKVRRAFFGQGKAIKAICRELGFVAEDSPQSYPLDSPRKPRRNLEPAPKRERRGRASNHLLQRRAIKSVRKRVRLAARHSSKVFLQVSAFAINFEQRPHLTFAMALNYLDVTCRSC